MLKITVCPTCGSEKIKHVCRDLARTVKGQDYVVPLLEFDECPDWREMVFDAAAMRKIQEHSPAFAKPRQKKKAA